MTAAGRERELLPCPFCGCDHTFSSMAIRDGWTLGCGVCAASVCAFSPDAPKKCVAAWNRRAPSSPGPEVAPVAWWMPDDSFAPIYRNENRPGGDDWEPLYAAATINEGLPACVQGTCAEDVAVRSPDKGCAAANVAATVGHRPDDPAPSPVPVEVAAAIERVLATVAAYEQGSPKTIIEPADLRLVCAAASRGQGPDLAVALKDANDVCRSAWQVLHALVTQFGPTMGDRRIGMLADRLHESLERQRAIMHPSPNAAPNSRGPT